MSTIRTIHSDSDAESSEVRKSEQAGQTAGGCDGTGNSPDRSSSSGHREKDAFFREILAQSGSGEVRQIEVKVQDGRIILRGRVSSFYQKQLAQESLLPVAIGMQICNQVEVDP